MPVSVVQCTDCRNNERFMCDLLEKKIDKSLLLYLQWESPVGLPANVLSRIAATYRALGWKVTWKNGSRCIHIWCLREKKEGTCVTRAKR